MHPRPSNFRLCLAGAMAAALTTVAAAQQNSQIARITETPSLQTTTAPVRTAAASVPPLPSIDRGPQDLTATDLFVKRHMTADFEGAFTQEAAVYMPVYYHGGYLALNAEDQAALRQLEKEISTWAQEQKNLNQRLGGLLERLQVLYDRGRPRGVIQESQLLVPYFGSEGTMKKDVDGLRMERVSQTKSNESAKANVLTGAVKAITVPARAPQMKEATK